MPPRPRPHSPDRKRSLSSRELPGPTGRSAEAQGVCQPKTGRRRARDAKRYGGMSLALRLSIEAVRHARGGRQACRCQEGEKLMIQDSRARMGPGGALVGSPVGHFAPAFAVDERTIDLAGLIHILRRRAKLIAATVACVLALAVSYILFTTPTYMADARILVDPRKKHTVGTEVVPSGLGENFAESFALDDSQVKMILSDAVLRPVVRSQHLAADPEFGAPREPNIVLGLWQAFTGLLSSPPPAESDNPEERALTALVKHMKVARDDQTFVIEIDVTTEDPAKSARLAQAIAESYLADQSNDKAETTVENFRAAHNLQEADGELIDTHQLKGLNDQVMSAQNDLAQAEAKYR